MLRKLVSVMISCAIVLSLVLVPSAANASDEQVLNGKTGDLTYNYDSETATLYLTGDGNTEEYKSVNDVPWAAYGANIQHISISSGVKEVDPSIFFYTSKLNSFIVDNNNTSFTVVDNDLYSRDKTKFYHFGNIDDENKVLDNAVETICDYAFLNNNKLTTLALPDKVKQIGEMAFRGTSLSELTLPEGVETIPYYCFKDTKKLTQITIGENLKKIGYGAFQDSAVNTVILDKNGDKSKDEYVTLPQSIKEIGDYAFYNSKIENLVVEGGLETIGEHAFSNSQLRTAVVPDTLTSIGSGIIDDTPFDNYYKYDPNVLYFGKYAVKYRDQYSVSDIILKEGTIGIADGGLNFNSINKLYIPASLKFVGKTFFVGLFSRLNKIELASDNQSFTLDNGILFNKDKTILYKCPYESTITNYTVPSTVKCIFTAAFAGCKSLNNVEIPSTVNEIGNGAFLGSGITSVSIPKSIKSISTQCFYGCDKLALVTFPDELETIGVGAFALCGLKSVKFPSKLKGIEWDSFQENTQLKEINIPNSVTYIGTSAFRKCSSLEKAVAGTGLTKLSSNLFSQCTSLKSAEFKGKVTSVLDDVFYKCSSLKTVSGLSNVTFLGERAFKNCSSLSGFTIPKGVTFIKDNVFENASNITLNASADFYSIGDYSFSGCKGLKIRSLGGLKQIGNYAFSKSDITKMVIPDTTTSIGASAFESCTDLAQIKIGKSIKTIKENCFKNCTSLKKLFLPPDTATLEKGSFESCPELTTLYLTNIDCTTPKSAFTKTTNISTVYFSGSEQQWSAKEKPELTQDAVIHYQYVINENDNSLEFDPEPVPRLNKTSLSLNAGKTAALNVIDGKANGFTVSDSRIAAVTSGGKVTALKKGKTKITAKLSDGKTLSCSVSVKNSPSIKIGKKKYSAKKPYLLKQKNSLSVKISGKASSVKNVYKSSNKKIAKVTSKTSATTVKIKGYKKGKATITLAVNGVKFKIKVKVYK